MATTTFESGFEETLLDANLTFADMYPLPSDTAMPPSPKRRVPDDLKEPIDWSGILIVTIVVVLVALAMLPTYSAWFRNTTGITSWLKTIENVLAVQPRGTYEGTKQGIIPARPK